MLCEWLKEDAVIKRDKKCVGSDILSCAISATAELRVWGHAPAVEIVENANYTIYTNVNKIYTKFKCWWPP
jgi:hypothetical protein